MDNIPIFSCIVYINDKINVQGVIMAEKRELNDLELDEVNGGLGITGLNNNGVSKYEPKKGDYVRTNADNNNTVYYIDSVNGNDLHCTKYMYNPVIRSSTNLGSNFVLNKNDVKAASRPIWLI